MNIEKIIAADLASKLARECQRSDITQCEVLASRAVLSHRAFQDTFVKSDNGVIAFLLKQPPFADPQQQQAALALEVVSAMISREPRAIRRRLPWTFVAQPGAAFARAANEVLALAGRGTWTPLASQGLIELLNRFSLLAKQRTPGKSLRIAFVLDPEATPSVREFASWHLKAANGVVIQLREADPTEKPSDESTDDIGSAIRPSWALVSDSDLEKIPLLAAARNSAAWIGLFGDLAEQAADEHRTQAQRESPEHPPSNLIECSIVPRKLLRRGLADLSVEQKYAPERWLLLDLLGAVAPEFFRHLKAEPISGPTDFFNWSLTWREGPSANSPSTAGDSTPSQRKKFAGEEDRIPKKLFWPKDDENQWGIFDIGVHSKDDASAFLARYFNRLPRVLFKAEVSLMHRWLTDTACATEGEDGHNLKLQSIEHSMPSEAEIDNLAQRLRRLPATAKDLNDGLRIVRCMTDMLALQEQQRQILVGFGLQWLIALSNAASSSKSTHSLKPLLAAFRDGVVEPDEKNPRWLTKSGEPVGDLESDLKELQQLDKNIDLLEKPNDDLLLPSNQKSLEEAMTALRMYARRPGISPGALGTPLLRSLVKRIEDRGNDMLTLHLRVIAILWTLTSVSLKDEGKRFSAGLRLSSWVEYLAGQRTQGLAKAPLSSPLMFLSYRRREKQGGDAPAKTVAVSNLLEMIYKSGGGRLIVDREIEEQAPDNWNDTLFRWLMLSDAQICLIDDRYFESNWCLLELLVAVVRTRMEPRFKLMVYRVGWNESALSSAKPPSPVGEEVVAAKSGEQPSQETTCSVELASGSESTSGGTCNPDAVGVESPKPNGSEAPSTVVASTDIGPASGEKMDEVKARQEAWDQLREALRLEVNQRTTSRKFELEDNGAIPDDSLKVVANEIKKCFCDIATWRNQQSKRS